MTATECMVDGCESSAHAISDLTADQEHQGWARLPAGVLLCNLHRDELAKPETEWMLTRDRDGAKLYVGDSLRNLNEYILVGIEEITGYGTGREFSHREEDGHHLRLRARRRGDNEKTMTLVIPSNEIAKDLQGWVNILPTGEAQPQRRPRPSN